MARYVDRMNIIVMHQRDKKGNYETTAIAEGATVDPEAPTASKVLPCRCDLELDGAKSVSELLAAGMAAIKKDAGIA